MCRNDELSSIWVEFDDELEVYYQIQNFLSYLQKIAKSFSHSSNFYVSGSPESVSEQPTQLIIAAHNCHINGKEEVKIKGSIEKSGN